MYRQTLLDYFAPWIGRSAGSPLPTEGEVDPFIPDTPLAEWLVGIEVLLADLEEESACRDIEDACIPPATNTQHAGQELAEMIQRIVAFLHTQGLDIRAYVFVVPCEAFHALLAYMYSRYPLVLGYDDPIKGTAVFWGLRIEASREATDLALLRRAVWRG